eukprot:GILJ01000646.1.p1 GENE.GILJ01000646.1~~GILJ01000646.1.p1  ORF type:complete len:201 (-),score=28.30 GILJ01000646.1:166-726(-)
MAVLAQMAKTALTRFFTEPLGGSATRQFVRYLDGAPEEYTKALTALKQTNWRDLYVREPEFDFVLMMAEQNPSVFGSDGEKKLKEFQTHFDLGLQAQDLCDEIKALRLDVSNRSGIDGTEPGYIKQNEDGSLLRLFEKAQAFHDSVDPSMRTKVQDSVGWEILVFRNHFKGSPTADVWKQRHWFFH